MKTLFVKSSTNSPRRYFQHTISAEPYIFFSDKLSNAKIQYNYFCTDFEKCIWSTIT